MIPNCNYLGNLFPAYTNLHPRVLVLLGTAEQGPWLDLPYHSTIVLPIAAPLARQSLLWMNDRFGGPTCFWEKEKTSSLRRASLAGSSADPASMGSAYYVTLARAIHNTQTPLSIRNTTCLTTIGPCYILYESDEYIYTMTEPEKNYSWGEF